MIESINLKSKSSSQTRLAIVFNSWASDQWTQSMSWSGSNFCGSFKSPLMSPLLPHWLVKPYFNKSKLKAKLKFDIQKSQHKMKTISTYRCQSFLKWPLGTTPLLKLGKYYNLVMELISLIMIKLNHSPFGWHVDLNVFVYKREKEVVWVNQKLRLKIIHRVLVGFKHV